MSNKLKISVLLAAIIALGFSLRVYKIADKGFFYYDEAYFLLETKTFTEGIKELREGLKTGFDLYAIKDRLVEKGCIFPPGTARPSYNLILIIPALLLGLKDYCVFLPSVFFSTLTIYLCFLLGKKLWDTRTALTAAFLVAVSAFNIMYARTGYGQITAGAFLLLGLYLYLNTLKEGTGPREAIIAGLTLGFAVTCHYGVLFSVAVLLGVETLLLLLKSHRRTLKTGLLLLLSFSAPILLYEFLYRAVKLALGASISGMNFMTYFEQFVYVGANAPRGLSLTALLANDYLFYPRVLLGCDGYLATALLFATGLYFLARLAKKRAPAELVLFAQSYALLAFWILNPGQVKGARILMLFHPLLLLLAAKMLTDGFSLITASEKNRNIFLSAFLVLLFAVNAGMTVSIITTRSLYRDTAVMLKEKGVTDVAAFTLWPIWQFYLGHKIWANLDRIKNEQELSVYCRDRKIDRLILDFREPIIDRTGRGEDYGFLNRIAQEQPPEFSLPVDTRRDSLFIYESTFPLRNPRQDRPDSFLYRIKCYRLDELGLNDKTRARASRDGGPIPSRPAFL